MTLKALSLICSLGITMCAQAHKDQSKPGEIKKTVEAFAGSWRLVGTETDPGAREPKPFTVVIDCSPTALGAAVQCIFKGQLPGVGPMEAASVIGYDPEGKMVRWMEISSTGEYHDHRGVWNGDRIEFDPLEYSIAGQKATEHLTIGFPSAGKLVLKSVTETVEGPAKLEGSANRQKR